MVSETDTRRSLMRSSRARLAGALIVAGVVLAAISLLGEVSPARSDYPAGVVLLMLATGLLLLLGPLWWLVAGADRRARRICSALAAGLALAGAVAAVFAVRSDLAGGLPTRVLPLLVAAFAVVAAGCLLLLTLPAGSERAALSRPAVRRVLSSAAIGVTAVALVVAALVGAAEVVVRTPLKATTADPGAVMEQPGAPSEVAWTYAVPEGGFVRSNGIVAAGSGAAVLLDDGVVALDGATGEERWRYRLVGAEAVQIAASPDGASVLVAFESSTEEAAGARLVVLDGVSGEVRSVRDSDQSPPPFGFLLPVTDSSLLGGDDDTVTGRPLADDSDGWSWATPDDCVREAFEPGRDTVLVALVCVPDDRGDVLTGEVVLVGLDDRTGAERWRHADRFTKDVSTLREGSSSNVPARAFLALDSTLLLGDDASAADFSWSMRDEAETLHRTIVDTADGRVLLPDGEVPDDLVAYDDQTYTVVERGRETDVDDYGAGVTLGRAATRRAYGGGPAQVLADPGCGGLNDSIVDLSDALVGVCDQDDFDPANGQETFGLSVLPWDGAPPRVVDVERGDREPDGYYDQARVLALPGAVVLLDPGHRTVVGLR